MKENLTEKKNKFKIANIIFWIVLGVVAVYAVVALTSQSDGVHSIFSYNFV